MFIPLGSWLGQCEPIVAVGRLCSRLNNTKHTDSLNAVHLAGNLRKLSQTLAICQRITENW